MYFIFLASYDIGRDHDDPRWIVYQFKRQNLLWPNKKTVEEELKKRSFDLEDIKVFHAQEAKEVLIEEGPIIKS